ncbi:MAG TPA: type II secretion system protein [Longimicrobium sp.]|nr:type II secretion system protein [Longimicrobium sp.]
MAPPYARSGYSLVEMLAVLTLLGILLAMAVPRLATAGYRNGATMSALGSTMLSAQRAAIARQHRVIVAVDATAQTLRVHYDKNEDGAINAGELVRVEPLPAGTVFGRGSAPAYRIGTGAVSFRGRQGSLPAIVFQRNGAASEEGGFYITSARDAKSGGYSRDARMLVVERATGRVSWSAYDGSTWKQSF